MRVGDLLDMDDFGLRLLAWPPGAAARVVTGVLAVDRGDAGRHLEGGELVLTGLGWWPGPEQGLVEAEEFASDLVEANIAALGAGEATLGGVPAELVDACRRYGVPVFGIPAHVPLRDIARRVLAQLGPEAEVAWRSGDSLTTTSHLLAPISPVPLRPRPNPVSGAGAAVPAAERAAERALDHTGAFRQVTAESVARQVDALSGAVPRTESDDLLRHLLAEPVSEQGLDVSRSQPARPRSGAGVGARRGGAHAAGARATSAHATGAHAALGLDQDGGGSAVLLASTASGAVNGSTNGVSHRAAHGAGRANGAICPPSFAPNRTTRRAAPPRDPSAGRLAPVLEPAPTPKPVVWPISGSPISGSPTSGAPASGPPTSGPPARRASGGRLLAVLAGRAGLDRLLEVAFTEMGVGSWVVSPAVGVVAGPGELSESTLRTLTETFLTAPELPVEVAMPAGNGALVLAADTTDRPRAASWYLVCELPPDGVHGTTGVDPIEIAEELAGLVALERARLDAARVAERRLTEQVLWALEVGPEADAELMVALRTCGVAPGTPLTVVVAGAAEPGPNSESEPTLLQDLDRGPAEVAAAILDEVLGRITPEPLVGVRGGEMIALVPTWEQDPSQVTWAVRAGLAAVGVDLATVPLAVGMSGEVEAGPGLHDALSEARQAAETAAQRVTSAGDRFGVARTGEFDTHAALLQHVPVEIRQTFREHVLGTVLAEDEANGGELVRSLTAYLEHGSSWSQVAAELNLSRDAVLYHLARIEELTGRDLAQQSDRVDLYLALRFG